MRSDEGIRDCPAGVENLARLWVTTTENMPARERSNRGCTDESSRWIQGSVAKVGDGTGALRNPALSRDHDVERRLCWHAMASDAIPGPDVSDEAVRAEIAGRLDYSGSDTETEERIVEVLVHLPEGVRTFSLERCRFASDSHDARKGVAGSDRVLVLVQDGLDESAIRHAIAHAWLGHDAAGLDQAVAVGEDEVRELVAQWEFTGLGADS